MPAGETQKREVMEAVRAPASYELVVEQIRRAIQSGRFSPGEKLPPERELARQLMVSRTTVREAMRVLQGEGLVEIRRGRNGGAVVTELKISAQDHRRLLRSRRAELEAIFDYRLAIEPAAARLAASKRTKSQLKQLRETLETMDLLIEANLAAEPETSPPSRFFSVDTDFHHQIALASRNDFLIKAVDDARSAIFLPVGGVFRSLHPDANRFHRDILQGIEESEPARAERAMHKHIEVSRDVLTELSRPPSGRANR